MDGTLVCICVSVCVHVFVCVVCETELSLSQHDEITGQVKCYQNAYCIRNNANTHTVQTDGEQLTLIDSHSCHSIIIF